MISPPSSSFKFHLLYGFECILTVCLILLSSRGFAVVVLHYYSETCKQEIKEMVTEITNCFISFN